jgi:hypothetical protein
MSVYVQFFFEWLVFLRSLFSEHGLADTKDNLAVRGHCFGIVALSQRVANLGQIVGHLLVRGDQRVQTHSLLGQLVLVFDVHDVRLHEAFDSGTTLGLSVKIGSERDDLVTSQAIGNLAIETRQTTTSSTFL